MAGRASRQQRSSCSLCAMEVDRRLWRLCGTCNREVLESRKNHTSLIVWLQSGCHIMWSMLVQEDPVGPLWGVGRRKRVEVRDILAQFHTCLKTLLSASYQGWVLFASRRNTVSPSPRSWLLTMLTSMSQGFCHLRNPGPGDSSPLGNQLRCDPGTRSISSPMTSWQQESTALAMVPGPVRCSGLPPLTWQLTWWASLWQVSRYSTSGYDLEGQDPCCNSVGRARGQPVTKPSGEGVLAWYLSSWLEQDSEGTARALGTGPVDCSAFLS